MDYFSWLCFWAVPDGSKRRDYSQLLLALHDIPFRWSVAHDENRAGDGLQLRSIYEDETGEWCDEESPDCTLLEMFLALAIRCDTEIMYDPDDLNRADRWFWMMIENLKLDKFTDENFDYGQFLDICGQFMDRNYGKNGQNCPFWVPDLSMKMRKIELFYQMNYYLKWRFPRFFE